MNLGHTYSLGGNTDLVRSTWPKKKGLKHEILGLYIFQKLEDPQWRIN